MPLKPAPKFVLVVLAAGGAFYALHYAASNGLLPSNIGKIMVPAKYNLPDVKDALVERLVEIATSMVPGPSLEKGTTVGPMVSRTQQAEVMGHVSSALGEGATILVGGSVGEGAVYERGCYVLPTVVDNVTTDMRIWREEVFGPVVAVVAVNSLDEAITLANASAYGLSAALFTRNLASADEFLRRIETGQAAVNLPTSGWDVHQPFGGYKLSGSPFKEQGLEAVGFYTRTKTCAVRSI